MQVLEAAPQKFCKANGKNVFFGFFKHIVLKSVKGTWENGKKISFFTACSSYGV